MRRQWIWLVVVALLAAALPVNAQDADGLAGYMRAGHFAPGLGAVDFYVDAVPGSADPLEYGQLLPWMEVPAGAHRVRVVPVGGSANEPILDVEVDFAAEWWATLAMVGGAAGCHFAPGDRSRTGRSRPGRRA